jgi:hypothetical protein
MMEYAKRGGNGNKLDQIRSTWGKGAEPTNKTRRATEPGEHSFIQWKNGLSWYLKNFYQVEAELSAAPGSDIASGNMAALTPLLRYPTDQSGNGVILDAGFMTR